MTEKETGVDFFPLPWPTTDSEEAVVEGVCGALGTGCVHAHEEEEVLILLRAEAPLKVLVKGAFLHGHAQCGVTATPVPANHLLKQGVQRLGDSGRTMVLW